MKKIPMVTLGDYLSYHQHKQLERNKTMPIPTPPPIPTAISVKHPKRTTHYFNGAHSVSAIAGTSPPVKIVEPVKTESTKTEPVVEEKKKKMKKWPDNKSAVLPYEDLVKPLKELLDKGYRLFRKAEVKEFDYEGYNIGEQELNYNDSPRSRFTEKSLAEEDKRGNKLVDVVLNIVFLLGVEQGRRAERIDSKSVEVLMQTLETYREKNKDLRIRVDELELLAEIKESNPNLSPEEVEDLVSTGLDFRRIERIEKLKSELQLDPSKSVFQFNTPTKSKFKELVYLFNTLPAEDQLKNKWKEILNQHGWTYLEWKEKCKKK